MQHRRHDRLVDRKQVRDEHHGGRAVPSQELRCREKQVPERVAAAGAHAREAHLHQAPRVHPGGGERAEAPS